MPYEFKHRRRIEFSDTDMAGIVHFANYFRFLESAEHAFLRSIGSSVHIKKGDQTFGWPRVHVSCDFKKPLKFEDEIEIHILIREVKTKSITYDMIIRTVGSSDDDIVAHGRVVTVYTTYKDGKLSSAPIPTDITDKLEVAPADKLPKEDA